MGPLPLAKTTDKVAFVHTDIRARYLVDQSDGSYRAGETRVRTSRQIEKRERADLFRGSYYAYRRAALMDVLGHVDRAFPHYEEWRIVWHLMRAGWQGLYVPEVLQEQHCRDIPAFTASVKATGRSWEKTVAELEDIFSDRWWQRWRQDHARGLVETYWKESPEQVERRKHFNDILRQVVAEAGVTSVLDFGCGTGEDYLFMSGDLGLAYQGVDVTPERLATARQKFPIIDVSEDDIFASKQGDRAHPFVVNSAVLPHLPLDKIPTAISELWRITGKVLVVRLFGVRPRNKDTTEVKSGFIYQRLREATWKAMFEKHGPGRLVIHRGPTKGTADIMVVVAWR